MACIEIALFQMLLPYIVIVGAVIGVILLILIIVGKLLNREDDNDESTGEQINNTNANIATSTGTNYNPENSHINKSKPKSNELVHVQESNVHLSPDQFEYQKINDKAEAADPIDDTNSGATVEKSLETVIVEKPVQTEVIEDVFCTSCGKKIPGNSAFCTYCGQRNKYQIGGLA